MPQAVFIGHGIRPAQKGQTDFVKEVMKNAPKRKIKLPQREYAVIGSKYNKAQVCLAGKAEPHINGQEVCLCAKYAVIIFHTHKAPKAEDHRYDPCLCRMNGQGYG